jgi:hypothetical protein
MTDELAARKARLISGLTKLAEEYGQLVTDNEYFNTLPAAERPVDFEEYRVLAHAAREALKCVQADRPIEDRYARLLWPKTAD